MSEEADRRAKSWKWHGGWGGGGKEKGVAAVEVSDLTGRWKAWQQTEGLMLRWNSWQSNEKLDSMVKNVMVRWQVLLGGNRFYEKVTGVKKVTCYGKVTGVMERWQVLWKGDRCYDKLTCYGTVTCYDKVTCVMARWQVLWQGDRCYGEVIVLCKGDRWQGSWCYGKVAGVMVRW